LGNRYGLQTRLHAGGEVLHGGRRAIEVLLAVVAHDNGDELNKLLLPLHLPLHPRHHVTGIVCHAHEAQSPTLRKDLLARETVAKSTAVGRILMLQLTCHLQNA